MLIECDGTCANYGCKRAGAIGCAAHIEPWQIKERFDERKNPEPSTLLIYIEAVLFLAAIVMCYLCVVTWGSV